MEILNIELEEKTDFTLRIIFRDDTTNLPVDLTGYSALLQIRPTWGSPIVLDELTSTSGNIILGGQAGTIDMVFIPGDTYLVDQTIGWARGTYDLIIIDPDGMRKKLLKGFVTVSRSATLI